MRTGRTPHRSGTTLLHPRRTITSLKQTLARAEVTRTAIYILPLQAREIFSRAFLLSARTAARVGRTRAHARLCRLPLVL